MKIVKNILFIILCIAVFCGVVFLSMSMYINHHAAKRLSALKVEWNSSVGTVITDLRYGDGKNHTYDLYLPAESRGSDIPLILYIHGGGFTSGDKAEGELWCKYFTSKGYVCASMNYDVRTEEDPHSVKEMYHNTEAAVVEIVNEAEKRGYIIKQMAITGESAGGCLALMYAYNTPADAPIEVKFVFEMTGPANFEPSLWGAGDSQSQADFLALVSGESVTAEMIEDGSYAEIAERISPYSYVCEDTVPTIIAYGSKDMIVPPAVKEKLLAALDQYQVVYDYIEFPNSGHGMSYDADKMEEYLNKVSEFCNSYFE